MGMNYKHALIDSIFINMTLESIIPALEVVSAATYILGEVQYISSND